MPLVLSGSGTIQNAAGTAGISIDSSNRVLTPINPHAICKMVLSNAGAYNVAAASTTLIPTNVLRNIGGIYNSSNGRFTAPVAGLYEINFSTNIYTAPASGWVQVQTFVNGSQYSQHYEDRLASNWQFMGFHDLVYLNANDFVTLIISCASGTTGCDVNNYTLISFALVG
jgi:hypothetical protein